MKKLFILIVLASALSFAQQPGDRWDMPMFGHKPVVEKLNLTSDQQKQFDNLHTDMQKKQIDLRSKVQTMRLDLRDLLKEDLPKKSKIESKLTDISKLQNDMKLNRVGLWFDVNKILTSDQQKIWKEHRMMTGRKMRAHHPSGVFGRGFGFRNEKYRRGMVQHDCNER